LKRHEISNKKKEDKWEEARKKIEENDAKKRVRQVEKAKEKGK